jgi:hypothetical protein
MKTEFIRYMKYAGVLVRPKDITRYSEVHIWWKMPFLECPWAYSLSDDIQSEGQF